MKSIFEYSRPGYEGYGVEPFSAEPRDMAALLGAGNLGDRAPRLPETSEGEAVRHFTNLSRQNYAIDVGFYPLGSCTMKYNPRVNEWAARRPGFAALHPETPDEYAQGALALLWNLERLLCEILGMDRVTLQPLAGAHGELTGLLTIQAYHRKRGQRRTKVVVPDSSHGTNPASANMAGMEIVTIASNARGTVDLAALRAAMGPDVAAFMLTNPNTLGLFDESIAEIAAIVHEAGALLYYDGANLNATLGYARPGDCGFDVVHTNLHKTFATPHGGGGPGSGPVGVKRALVPFLPKPLVEERDGVYRLDDDRPDSIGRMAAFHGNFGVLVRAYAYIRAHGGGGLKRASEDAVLHANYLMRRLKGLFDLPYDRPCMHEFVLSADNLVKACGVRALDVAKRLLDLGYHAPTIYFPLCVHEAIMIEPTETESLATLDAFAAAMERIAAEARSNPEILKNAPTATPVRRLDETRAARDPEIRWTEAE